MDRVEQAVVRQVLRQMVRSEPADRIGTHNEVRDRLMRARTGITERDADSYLYTNSVKQGIQNPISEAALDILVEDREKVITRYRALNPDVLRLLTRIFAKDRGIQTTEMPPIISGIAQRVFSNWTHLPHDRYGSLRTGLYQTFRRYKPTREQKLDTNPTYNWKEDLNHAVICELWYIDLTAMECKMVTGDLNLYHGTMCITHEAILYALLQRPFPNGVDFHQRFIVSKIEITDIQLYSGIMSKIGNINISPIAADMFYRYVPEELHQELYNEFMSVRQRSWEDRTPIAPNSTIADYIAITPPSRPRNHSDWQRVRYLRDFPALAKMGVHTPNYIALFREPLRTLNAGRLHQQVMENELEVYQKSRLPTTPPV